MPFVDRLCNVMSWCGFPNGDDTRQTSMCVLYNETTRAVPSSVREALCGDKDTKCEW